MDAHKTITGIFVFIFFYIFMSTLIFGNNFMQSNPFPDINTYFSISSNINLAENITGGQWIINFIGNKISFEFLHQIIIWIMIPFVYIYQIFAFIITIFIWLENAIVFPFNYLPDPFSTFGKLFITGLILIEIVFSIRVLSSGLGGS